MGFPDRIERTVELAHPVDATDQPGTGRQQPVKQ